MDRFDPPLNNACRTELDSIIRRVDIYEFRRGGATVKEVAQKFGVTIGKAQSDINCVKGHFIWEEYTDELGLPCRCTKSQERKEKQQKLKTPNTKIYKVVRDSKNKIRVVSRPAHDFGNGEVGICKAVEPLSTVVFPRYGQVCTYSELGYLKINSDPGDALCLFIYEENQKLERLYPGYLAYLQLKEEIEEAKRLRKKYTKIPNVSEAENERLNKIEDLKNDMRGMPAIKFKKSD